MVVKFLRSGRSKNAFQKAKKGATWRSPGALSLLRRVSSLDTRRPPLPLVQPG